MSRMDSANLGDAVMRAVLAMAAWIVAGVVGLAGVALGLAARSLLRR